MPAKTARADPAAAVDPLVVRARHRPDRVVVDVACRRPGQRVRIQPHALEQGAGQVRAARLRGAHVAAPEVRAAERGVGKVGVDQARAGEVAAGEVGAAELRAMKVRVGGRYAAQRRAP